MLRIIAIVVACFVSNTALPQEHPSDLLKESWIKAKWSQALKGVSLKRWDQWIPNLGGVGSAPVVMRDGSGKSWTVAELCQPHDCGDNKLVVIIDRPNQRIWGMQLTANPTTRRYFGTPDDDMKAMLGAGLKGSLATVRISGPAAATPPDASAAQGGSTDRDIDETVLTSQPGERREVPVKREQAGEGPASEKPATWRYGRHPLFGQSAHIDADGESVGLACGFQGVDLMRSDAVLFRITRGLSPESTKPGHGIFFVEGQPSGGSSLFETHPRGFLEQKENACGVVQAFQRGKSIIFAEGTFVSLESRGKAFITTLMQRGVKKQIGGDRDLHKLVDTKRVPLTGAATAIRQLVNACPAIRADFRNDCGV